MKKGFTLIELVVIVALIAVLALITIPVLLDVYQDVKETSYKNSVAALSRAGSNYFSNEIAKKIRNNEYYNYDRNIYNEIEFSGAKPDEAEIVVNSSGQVGIAAVFGGKCYRKSYDSDQVVKYDNYDYCTMKAVVSTPASCFTRSVNTITNYTVNGTTCTTDVVIPKTISGVNINTISNSAFSGKGLTSLYIPNTISTIKSSAFSYNNLTYVDIPNSVTTLENGAFGDNKIKDLVLSEGLSLINDYVFQNNLIENLVVPSNINSIEFRAFYNNKIKSISFNTAITKIGQEAFGTNKLTDLNIPSSVTTISSGAFNNNQLPDEKAFIYKRNANGSVNNTAVVSYGGARKKDIVFPTNITSLEQDSFSRSEIESFIVSPYINRYAVNCFANNKLTSLIIGDVNGIGSQSIVIYSNAFANNIINNLYLGTKVTNVYESAFNNNLLPDSQAFIYKKNGNGTNDNTQVVSYGGFKKSNVILPSTVTTVKNSAFRSVELESITLNNNLTTIEDYAFFYNNLTTITIPNSVTIVGNNAFMSNLLTYADLGTGVNSIGTYSFYSNRIPQGSAIIRKSSGTVAIGANSFSQNGTLGNQVITPTYMP